MRASHFIALVSLLPTALALTSCVEPTNPCDPGADPALQAQGTRLAGLVLDEAGVPAAGVLVGIAGRGETLTSGVDGSFAFTNIPPAPRYELLALPAAPLVGGRTVAPALGCKETVEGVELRVVRPPSSPDVELVRATSARRVFAAFGASENAAALATDGVFFNEEGSYIAPEGVRDLCAGRAESAALVYRAQVRQPFGVWVDAVLSPFPWLDVNNPALLAELGALGYFLDRIDDSCARDFCSPFAYLEPDLENQNARCIDVVGIKDGDAIRPLAAFGSYEVRVFAESRTDPALQTAFALPPLVASDVPTRTGQMSLLPGAVMPLVDSSGAPFDARARDIQAVIPAAGGRFALLDSDGLSIVGGGEDVLDNDAQAAVGENGVPHGAAARDESAEDNVNADFFAEDPDAVPVAALPSGAWVRVVKAGAGGASIEKLYLGDSAEAAREGPSLVDQELNDTESALSFDPLDDAAGALRAFTYLSPPSGVLSPGFAQGDGYLLLYENSFVLLEDARPGQQRLAYFAEAAAGNLIDNTVIDASWSDGVAGDAAAGACAGFVDSRALDVAGRKVVTVCYDVRTGLGEDVALRDVEVLSDGLGSFHLLSDAQNDRILSVRTSELLCEGCDVVDPGAALHTKFASVPVGREPSAMIATARLSCDDDGNELSRASVVLVANRGSADLSVLEGDTLTVRETDSLALPGAPRSFLEDPEGPTCNDPFVWVLADDGRVFPVDMRGAPRVPGCDDRSCEISTRGRGGSGAVSRGAVRSRALVGGPGLLGELGFFRPAALSGAAYADNDQIIGGGADPEPGSN